MERTHTFSLIAIVLIVAIVSLTIAINNKSASLTIGGKAATTACEPKYWCMDDSTINYVYPDCSLTSLTCTWGCNLETNQCNPEPLEA